MIGFTQDSQVSLVGSPHTLFSVEDTRKITDFKSLSKLVLRALVKAH